MRTEIQAITLGDIGSSCHKIDLISKPIGLQGLLGSEPVQNKSLSQD